MTISSETSRSAQALATEDVVKQWWGPAFDAIFGTGVGGGSVSFGNRR